MRVLKFTLKGLSILIDLSGIILSMFSQDQFNNSTFSYIVHFCRSFRTELLLLLVLFICLYWLIPFILKTIKPSNLYNKILCGFAFISAVAYALPPALGLVKARYYYFNNNIVESHAQFAALEKSVAYMAKGEYPMAIKELDLAAEFSDAIKFQKSAEGIREQIRLREEVSSFVYRNFVKNTLTLDDKYHYLVVCTQLNPNEYMREKELLEKVILEAIDAYPQFYESFYKGNYIQCRRLISSYGDVWFEPIVKERLLHDNEQFIMRLLEEYLGAEDSISAQKRLTNKYFDNNML